MTARHSFDKSRRNLLKNAALAGSFAAISPGNTLFGTELLASRTSLTNVERSIGRISGIDPANVVEEFKARNLDASSDADIYGQVVEIISKPPKKGLTSFTLHAPLELMARYGLLPHIDPNQRSVARLQMVTSAAAFEHGVIPAEAPTGVSPFPSLATARKELAGNFQNGDAAGIESTVLQIAAQFGTASLVQSLTPLALPTMTGASHSHIGLWLLLRHGRTTEVVDASLLRAAARHLAQDPKAQLSSFSGMAITGGKPLKMNAMEIEREILSKLADPPRTDEQSRGSLRSLLQAGEQTGNADQLFGDFIRHDLTNDQIDAAFRAILRACAHSMLQDDVAQAKFGWSHCLTLPQAACGLSCLNMDRKLALAATLVWVTAYRTALSRRALDFNWAPEKQVEGSSFSEALQDSPSVAAAYVWHAAPSERRTIRHTLATEASIRNDQHLVKYTRACFDICSFDPMQDQLYLSAAAHLCSHWIQERPRSKILDNLLQRRDTP